MRLLPLLTSFRGRISRKPWWTAFAIVIAATVIGSLVLDPGIWTADPPRPPTVALALWDLFLVVPMTAASVKRFNDRDWPRWFGYALGALGVALIAAEQCGFMVDPDTSPASHQALFWCVATVFALALIDNGFFHGTDGPTRHGPDPLPPAV
jgi:uncharacterized membrane protein YhaH (DUF805 family)